MTARIWISLFLSLFLLVLLPLLFGQLLAASLTKLNLETSSAILLVFAIIVGSFINIPVRRVRHSDDVIAHPLTAFGLSGFWPKLQRVRRETVIAVNLGGCIIPVGLAIYEFAALIASDVHFLWAVAAAALINTAICYFLARPVLGIGIALPGLVPGIVAALCALLFAPDHAAPVAFIAGVSGPLIGADLLHLKDVNAMRAAVVSIGGAGTFDGIFLSGILAAYLA